MDLQSRLSLLITAIGTDVKNLSAVGSDNSIATAHPPGYAVQNFYTITAQAVALSFGTTGGTEVDGNRLIIRVKDNGTARAISYVAGNYRSLDSTNLPLPTTTAIGKWLYMGFVYNGTDAIWDLVSVLNQT